MLRETMKLSCIEHLFNSQATSLSLEVTILISQIQNREGKRQAQGHTSRQYGAGQKSLPAWLSLLLFPLTLKQKRERLHTDWRDLGQGQ
jgi:hypothetical protein